ncbi:MAG: zinc-ribbon and DUF3426 domain-containing protein [Candidatus Thiodiazotropha sp. (ex Epidulcina cf. delphinae)]|nr:zinc-ribbon and DUF3426 domain-containing protein [Candidatus Thiodiazotropha sp. (ex Epidulcina cf. delphinae)]
MFTQCPHCLTLFRITPGQLKAAEGNVRCNQCNSVFNALMNLLESPAPFSNDPTFSYPSPSPASAVGSGALLGVDDMAMEGGDRNSVPVNDSEMGKSLDALADGGPCIYHVHEDTGPEVSESGLGSGSQDLFLLEQDDGLATEPDYFAAGTESQMSELLDQDSASLLLSAGNRQQDSAEVIGLEVRETESTPTDPAQSLDLETEQPEETMPPADSTTPDYPASSISSMEDEHASATFTEEKKPFIFAEGYDKNRPRNRLFWVLGSLLLIIPLSGQIVWQLRDNLIHNHIGRQLLGGVCRIAGCEVPIRRATEKILISERTLTTHSEKKNVLSLKLEMVNTAAFQQPYPKLQLSLYNDMGQLIARRTFSPDEYRTTHDQAQTMMPRLKSVHVELELADPGNEVTGFKFDFL